MIGYFIDGSYLRKAWQRGTTAFLSYDRLRPCIEHECSDKIAVAYWFDGQYPDDRSHDRRRAALLRAGFRVHDNYRVARERLKDDNGHPLIDPRTKSPLEVSRQKGVDVGLAVAIVRSHIIDKWDHLVLAAGDADFAEVVQDLVERHGVRFTIMGEDASVSCALRAYASAMVNLSGVVPLLSSLGVAS